MLQTPLHAAAKECKGDICKLIAENVEETNPADDFGHTPEQLWIEAAGKIQNVFK